MPLFLSFRNTPSENDGFTAVILTYDRIDSLFNVIRRISVSIKRILFNDFLTNDSGIKVFCFNLKVLNCVAEKKTSCVNS